MKYPGQPMHEYVAKWVLCCAQLALLDVRRDVKLLVTMCTEYSGNSSRLPYVPSLSVLLTKGGSTLQALMSHMLQHYSSQNAMKSARLPCEEGPNVASSLIDNKEKKKDSKGNVC